MKTKRKTIQCGDWHLGWGYSGNDKVGKLTLNDDGSFTWKGSSQGRHGQIWNAGANLYFWLIDGETPQQRINVINQNGNVPKYSELVKSCEELLSN